MGHLTLRSWIASLRRYRSRLTSVGSAYSAYLIFFHDEVARLGPVGVLEEYVFSPHAVSFILHDMSGHISRRETD